MIYGIFFAHLTLKTLFRCSVALFSSRRWSRIIQLTIDYCMCLQQYVCQQIGTVWLNWFNGMCKELLSVSNICCLLIWRCSSTGCNITDERNTHNFAQFHCFLALSAVLNLQDGNNKEVVTMSCALLVIQFGFNLHTAIACCCL